MQCLYNGNFSMAPINSMSQYRRQLGKIEAAFQLILHQSIEPGNIEFSEEKCQIIIVNI